MSVVSFNSAKRPAQSSIIKAAARDSESGLVHRCYPSLRLFVCLFVCLSPKCKKTRFSQKLSNLELWCLLTTIGSYVIGLFKEPITWSIKSKMAEIRHLEYRQDVIFSRGWSDLNKISETGAEWHVDCGDVIEIETRCRIPIWRTFGRIQWHVI